MKKRFALLLVCQLLLLVGCRERALVIGRETPHGEALAPITSMDGITLEKVTHQSKSCRFWLTNSTQSTFTMNADYTLEVWRDGTWYEPASSYDSYPQVDMLFLEHLQPGETKRFAVSLEYYDISDLQSGEYRIVLQGGWDTDRPQDWFCIPFRIA